MSNYTSLGELSPEMREKLSTPEGAFEVGMNAALKNITEAYGSNAVSEVEESLAKAGLGGLPDSRWIPLNGSVDWDDQEGPSLEEVKKRYKEIRDQVYEGSLIKRGSELRSEHLASDKIKYSSLKPRFAKMVNDPINWDKIFGPQATKQREIGFFTSGHHFLLMDNVTKRGQVVPLLEITDILRSPDDASEIWAYRRAWMDYSLPGAPEEKVAWYYTDLYYDKRGTATTVRYQNKSEKIDTSKTMIDAMVNRQSGTLWGWPDAATAIGWQQAYVSFIRAGMIVSDAMARFLFKISAPTKKSADQAAMAVSGTRGVGQTLSSSGGMDASALSTAGKAFDFSAGLELAAGVAQAVGVSVVSLTANPGNSGSSYGSGNLLTPSERMTVENRRIFHVEFLLRILRWMGAVDPEVKFDGLLLDSISVKNDLQTDALAWNTGLFHPDEMRAMMANNGNINLLHPSAPEGIMTPNNENWLQSNTADDDGLGSTPQAGAGQGQATGVGSDSNPDAGVPDNRSGGVG